MLARTEKHHQMVTREVSVSVLKVAQPELTRGVLITPTALMDTASPG